MIRVLIDFGLPICLPALLWALWLIRRQAHARAKGLPVPAWTTVPWLWLLVAGGALALVLTLGGALLDDHATGQYQPARLDAQGKLVPGQIK